MTWPAPEIRALVGIVAARLDPSGLLLEANAGFLRILEISGTLATKTSLSHFFIQPTLATLLAVPTGEEGEIYNGLLTVGDERSKTRTLRARIWRCGEEIRLVADFDIEELERVNQTVLDLNQDYAKAQRALFLSNLRLQRLNDELEQHRNHLEELVEKRTAEMIATEVRATHLLQSSADGLYGVDPEGNVTFINRAACELLGRSPEDAVGKSAHGLFHHSKADGTPYPIEECKAHRAIQDGVETRVDNEVYWHADGHPVPVMLAVHPLIVDGNNNGSVISFVDISEQRATALAREKAIAAAENLARVRSEFLSNMSHEIRTPINGVLGFAEIGFQNYQNSDKVRNAFEKILISGKRLLGVINDVLDFSKMEAGKLTIERTTVSLRKEIEQIASIVRPLAQAKHLDLRIDIAPDLPETCTGDPLRISQVLLNLLSNAVKFTAVGSVKVVASIRDNILNFRVTDTGVGMSEGQIRDLFIPFQQSDSSMTRRFGGTGLGLCIAKHLAELMEGNIRVESQLGIGSTFEFHLPFVAAAEPTMASQPATAEQSACRGHRLDGICIIVVEDDPIIQQVIEYILVEEGARVVVVNSGRDALNRIIQDGPTAYDIVLMDMQMPEIDGLIATRRILEVAPGLPIIGQTAHAFAEEREKCLAAGMVGHIAKPIDPDALVDVILQHVAGRRHHAIPLVTNNG